MALHVKIVNNTVTQVWDSAPPSGETGWHDAIEIRPTLVAGRQKHTAHVFDTTTDPVQIVYGTEDITVDERKEGMTNEAKSVFEATSNAEIRAEIDATDATADLDTISAARVTKDASIAAINACTTHDELDALA